MARHAIKLPDVGEGITEAEIVEWHVGVGDLVGEDDVVAAVMTDKATVEIPSSVSGTVLSLGGEVGDTLAVGSDLVVLETAAATAQSPAGMPAEGASRRTPEPAPPPASTSTASQGRAAEGSKTAGSARHLAAPGGGSLQGYGAKRSSASDAVSRSSANKPTAAPSVRRRAREAGIDLRAVPGSGPGGRILHEDLDALIAAGPQATVRGPRRNTAVKEIKVVGLRRRIAERMTLANARIPHITIVEEVDVSNLEGLREELSTPGDDARPKLTLLPFLIRAIVAAVREQPELNAHFDDEAGIVSQFGGVHVGVATHTPNGLIVPVVRHAEVNSLWENAREITRLSSAARDNSLESRDLTGSTITITSLGPLGAIATTPIINPPEVAVVGINKISIRPWWDGQQFVPRKMMNISCSFDHRIIDGYPAALFVQKLKALIEKPALLFVEGWPDV